MLKRSIYLICILGLLAIISANNTFAWPSSSYYVQEVDTAPTVDGVIDIGEWDTDEDKFEETIEGLVFNYGTQSSIKIEVIVLRDTSNLYVLVKVLSEITGGSNNMSIGLAFSDKNMDGVLMSLPGSSIFDRKVASYNGSHVITYDFHACSGAECSTPRSVTPGVSDTTVDFNADYGNPDGTPFFEWQIPLDGDLSEDIIIGEGSHMKILVNPYVDIAEKLNGHGGRSSKNLEFSYSQEALFERPEGPMDTMAIIFNSIFALLVSGMGIVFILSARNDKFAQRAWRVNITEKMANDSTLMEIGYYNSSFLGLFSLSYFMMYSVIALIYGFWANWGVPGLIINGIPSIICIIAFIDLAKRNHNPQEIPEEEKKPVEDDVLKTGGLWIVPPLFLGLVLIMLLFIGIDVIS